MHFSSQIVSLFCVFAIEPIVIWLFSALRLLIPSGFLPLCFMLIIIWPGEEREIATESDICLFLGG